MTQNSNIVIEDEVFYYGLVDWLILQGLEKFFSIVRTCKCFFIAYEARTCIVRLGEIRT